jgi:hypothetical protein
LSAGFLLIVLAASDIGAVGQLAAGMAATNIGVVSAVLGAQLDLQSRLATGEVFGASDARLARRVMTRAVPVGIAVGAASAALIVGDDGGKLAVSTAAGIALAVYGLSLSNVYAPFLVAGGSTVRAAALTSVWGPAVGIVSAVPLMDTGISPLLGWGSAFFVSGAVAAKSAHSLPQWPAPNCRPSQPVDRRRSSLVPAGLELATLLGSSGDVLLLAAAGQAQLAGGLAIARRLFALGEFTQTGSRLALAPDLALMGRKDKLERRSGTRRIQRLTASGALLSMMVGMVAFVGLESSSHSLAPLTLPLVLTYGFISQTVVALGPLQVLALALGRGRPALVIRSTLTVIGLTLLGLALVISDVPSESVLLIVPAAGLLVQIGLYWLVCS